MKRSATLLLALASLAILAGSLTSSSAVRGDSAKYVGGTIELKEKTNGKLSYEDSEFLLFHSKRGEIRVPYGGIESIEYGQKVGRRVGLAVAVSPLFLFSKKRKHILTIGWTDPAGEPQGVVVEVPKGTAKSFITIIEVRSGVDVEYESEEARKHVHG